MAVRADEGDLGVLRSEEPEGVDPTDAGHVSAEIVSLKICRGVGHGGVGHVRSACDDYARGVTVADSLRVW